VVGVPLLMGIKTYFEFMVTQFCTKQVFLN